jgi:DNA-directed RNA polymerase specialized sigma24 family protein
MKEIYVNGQFVEVSEEVFTEYNKGNRKMRYMEQDLKVERIIIEPISETIKVIPSREDSLNRLIDESKKEFAIDQESAEDNVVQRIMISEMRNCLLLLNADELELINALFFEGYTERSWSKHTGIAVMTLYDRKIKILNKLKKLMKI